MKNSLHFLFISFSLITFTASAQKPNSLPADRFAGLDNSTRNTNLSHKLDDYAVTYMHEGYGKYIVQLTNDSLLLLIPSTQKYGFDQDQYDTFRLFETDKGTETTYQDTRAGDIDVIAVTYLEPPINKQLVFDRYTSPKPVCASLLLKIVGEYEFNGLTARIELRGEKTLYLIVSGEPGYELEFIGNQVFSNKQQPNCYVHFEVDEQGDVTTISTIQPNGQFTFTRRTGKPFNTAKTDYTS